MTIIKLNIIMSAVHSSLSDMNTDPTYTDPTPSKVGCHGTALFPPPRNANIMGEHSSSYNGSIYQTNGKRTINNNLHD